MKTQSHLFKRLIKKYEFLLDDWKDVEEIANSANQEFSSEIARNKPETIDEADYTDDDEEEKIEEKDEETWSDKVLKKLFRKIVFQCHPDKLQSDLPELERIKYVSLYEQAISAHEDRNWALMVITAIKLGVELPEEAEDMLDKISVEAQELEQKIQNVTNSMSWFFYHSDEEERKNILENYLKAISAKKENN